jgi:hypothetical protein
MYASNLYPGAALLAAGLGLHGYRKGSLSRSGAIAAFLVGYGHLANPLKLFGVTMIAFYLIGSRATKVTKCLSMWNLTRADGRRLKLRLKSRWRMDQTLLNLGATGMPSRYIMDNF